MTNAIKLLLFALALTVVAYARVLHAPFVYEDAMSVKPVTRVTWQTPLGWLTTGRALTRISFDANYLLSGPSPTSYHATNLGLHVVNGTLVHALIVPISGPTIAAMTAAIFLVHPLQRQAVSYISGRAELLATLFVLIACLAVSLPLNWKSGSVFLVATVCAMASKETAAVVVLLAPLLVWARRGDIEWLAVLALLPLLALVHLYGALGGNPYAFASARQWLGFPALHFRLVCGTP